MLIYLYSNDYPEGGIPHDQQPASIQQPVALPHLRTSISSVAESLDELHLVEDPLLNNVQVYAIAEKYDMPQLKELARGRVQFTAKQPSIYSDTVDFSEVVKTVFDSTPASDTGLRNIIIQCCIDHIQEIFQDLTLMETIMDIGPLSFAIMMKTRQHNIEALERALVSEAILQVDLSRSISETRRASEQESLAVIERDQAISSLNSFMTRLDSLLTQSCKWDECRQCGDDFDSKMERFGSGNFLELQLRCKSCRTRHDIGAGLGF